MYAVHLIYMSVCSHETVTQNNYFLKFNNLATAAMEININSLKGNENIYDINFVAIIYI